MRANFHRDSDWESQTKQQQNWGWDLGNRIWAKFGLGNGIYIPLQGPTLFFIKTRAGKSDEEARSFDSITNDFYTRYDFVTFISHNINYNYRQYFNGSNLNFLSVFS